MSQLPICSVITPCYNAADYIGRTIQSVQRQTLTEWEHIVVDDGSGDGSPAAVEALRRDEPRLRLIRQANAGVAAARNAGAAAASPSSKYLLFLDHDDCLEPEALATLVHYLEERPHVGAVYCAWRLIDAADRPIAFNPLHLERRAPSWYGVRPIPAGEPGTPFATLLSCFNAYPSATLHRRSVFQRTAGFDPTYRFNSDKEIVLRMALHAPVHHLPVTLMRYRQHETNMSTDPAMFAELMDLFQNWWHDRRLTPRQQRMVRTAILFDRLLSAGRDTTAVVEHAKRRQLIPASRRAVFAARKIARLSLTATMWIWSHGPLGSMQPRLAV